MNKNLILSVILSFFILTSNISYTYAQPEQVQQTEPAGTEQVQQEEVLDDSPAPHASAALLIDLKSGKVLFNKNESEKMYPASTTKILTGILTLENANLEDVVIAQKDAIEPITNQHSHMGILIGEELTVEQLLYGMLVYSANDAANVLAVHIAGSIEAFAMMMNEKAAELGAKNTHFSNPHGFHSDDHYTTAEDLAAIARYAMQNEKFREIVKTNMYTMEPTNKYHETRYLSNTNHLISNKRRAEYYYKKATGIKTGFTDEAGSCLVASAQDGDTELLSVVMKCQNTTIVANGAYSFVDSKNLLEYGFDNFKYITIAANGDIVSDSGVYEAKNNIRVALTPENDISGLLPIDIKLEEVEMQPTLNENISAPINKGDILGTIQCVYKGEIIGSSNLIATNDVKKDYIIAAIHLFIKIITHPVFIVIFLLLIYLNVASKIRQDKKRKQRRSHLSYVNENTDYYQSRERDRYKRRRK